MSTNDELQASDPAIGDGPHDDTEVSMSAEDTMDGDHSAEEIVEDSPAEDSPSDTEAADAEVADASIGGADEAIDDASMDGAPPSTPRTFESAYQPEPIPKTGVVLASLTLLAAAAGLVFYIFFPPPAAVFTVDGESTNQDELVALLGDLTNGELTAVAEDPAGAALESRAQLSQLISSLILEDLLLAEADEAGVDITAADIQAELDTILADGFQGDQAAFDDAIAGSGLSPEGIDQQVRTTLLVQRLAEEAGDDEVSEDDIQAAYDAQFTSDTVAHILVETEDEANDVLARLEDGEAFADLAMELSIDPGSGARGGDLGPFQPGAFVPEFEEGVLATSPGEITGPVESQFGFHIITINPPPSLDDVRGLIEEGLAGQGEQAAIQSLLTRLDGEADVTVDPLYGDWVGLLQGGVIPPQPEAAELPELPELPVEDGQ